MAISWKWTHLAQKWPTRQNWGCLQHLGKFSKSGDAAVCLIDFENFISFKPGWSSCCSSWQCCRTQLVLQFCQLHHLLTRSGLGVNHCQSSSIRQPSFCLNQSNGDIWHPYVIPGPARQLPARACPPRRHPGRSGRIHSSLPRPLSPETRPQWAHRRELTPASSYALLAALLSTKPRPQLLHEPLSTLHPLTRHETLRWADIPNFPQIGSPWPSSPANSMPSSSEPHIFSG